MEENVEETDNLSRAEELIEKGELDEAQELIFSVKEKSARKCFVQSKLFKAKGWYNEQRKQLKAAIKLEPENEEYKEALDELEKFRKSDEFKTVKKQMGWKEDFREFCCMCSCELCGSALCDLMCNGCS